MFYLRIKAIPKCAKTEISEIIIDGEGEKTHKIRLKAPAEKGKANKELIKFLSSHYQVPKENVSIISGKTDRLKLIKIIGSNKP